MSAGLQREPWEHQAACAASGIDPEQFVPTGSSAVVQQQVRSAKRICAPCPVTAQCLQYALSRPEMVGVWGATSTQERDAIRRGARQQAA